MPVINKNVAKAKQPRRFKNFNSPFSPLLSESYIISVVILTFSFKPFFNIIIGHFRVALKLVIKARLSTKSFFQEKMWDREGDAQSSPWDILI